MYGNRLTVLEAPVTVPLFAEKTGSLGTSSEQRSKAMFDKGGLENDYIFNGK